MGDSSLLVGEDIPFQGVWVCVELHTHHSVLEGGNSLKGGEDIPFLGV